MIVRLHLIHQTIANRIIEFNKDGIIDRTIEREGLSQKEYFYKIVDINSSESQELFE